MSIFSASAPKQRVDVVRPTAAKHDGTPPQAPPRAAPPTTRAGRPSTELSHNLLATYRSVRRRHFARQRVENLAESHATGLTLPDGSPFNPRQALANIARQDIDPTTQLPDGISDDDQGNFMPLPGEEIYDRYCVQATLGSGTFGVVLRCFDSHREDFVAVKVVRAHPSYTAQGKSEVGVLVKLAEWTRPHAFGTGSTNTPRRPQQALSPTAQSVLTDGADHVVKLRKNFMWRGHLCLVFELLSHTLYDLVRRSRYVGISLNLVGKFGVQLSKALHLLCAAPQPIIHCDVKPENILLAKSNRSHIKLVDFGSSCFIHGDFKPRYVQSRFYRAPEVMLRVAYGCEVDVWSCACVLAELFTGKPLFGGRSEPDQLNRIQAILGPIPKRLVDQSPKRTLFKLRKVTGPTSIRSPYYFELTPPRPAEGGGPPQVPPGSSADCSDYPWDDSQPLSVQECAASLKATLIKTKLARRNDAAGGAPLPPPTGDDEIDDAHLTTLCDMLALMLRYDKKERLTPAGMLRHDFFVKHAAMQAQLAASGAPGSAMSMTTSANPAPGAGRA